MKPLILASTSPRRCELLSWLGVEFEAIAPDFDEEAVFPSDFSDVREYVKTLAVGKGLSVRERFDDRTVILSADTIVVWHGQVFNKPKDFDDARQMLEKLFGDHHTVLTALCVLQHDRQPVVKVVNSEVFFRPVSEKELNAYLQVAEPLDKAGGYMITAHAKPFLEKLEGSWTNVLGFPLHAVNALLSDAGVEVKVDVEDSIQRKIGVKD